MGSEEKGGSSEKKASLEAVEVRKERKRQLVLDSSDSELDGYYISPRKKAGAGADGNADRMDGEDRDARERCEEAEVKQGDGSDKKEILASDGEKKTRGASLNAENDAKRIKMEPLGGGNVQVDRIGVKKLRPGFPEWRFERAEVRAGRVLGIKHVMESRGKDVSKGKRRQSTSSRTSSLGDEKKISSKATNANSVKWNSRENNRDREEVIRVQGRRGVLKLLTKNKKVDANTRGNAYREDEEKGRDFGSPSVTSIRASSKQLDMSGERKISERSTSSIKLKKRVSGMGEVSLSKKSKIQDPKSDPRTSLKIHHQLKLHPKAENVRSNQLKIEKKRLPEHMPVSDTLSPKRASKVIDLPDCKSNYLDEGEGMSSSSLPKKHGMERPRAVGRKKFKQEVREQIKRMLLDAGWKIELRPRKGRDYEDSVYVSPQGTGYWSITKAYAVFQDQLNDGNCAERSSKLKNLDQRGTGVSFRAIPKDDLAMLKRNVVNKRRTKEDLDGADNRCRDGRGTNSRENFVRRHSRKEHSYNKDDGLKCKHRGCALLVRSTTQDEEDDMDDYIPYEHKRTILSWMIDLGIVAEDAKVKYMNGRRTRTMLEGRIRREGIHCSCCCKILTVSKFELHAGSKQQQPYENIFVEDGEVSLLQCLLNAWKKQGEYENKGFYEIDAGDDPNDDTCGICGDGGDLICCDQCPSTFHLACLGIQMPHGDWYCRNCSCSFCSSTQESTSSSAQLLSCFQCAQKFHRSCIPGTARHSASVNASGSTTSFCGPGCSKIYKRLQKLLGVKNDMEAGFSWSLIRCFDENLPLSLSNPSQTVECNSKISVAFGVMDECFLPLIDTRSGINLIHNVVHNCGSNFNRLDFSGFYTFILERGDEIISAASVRIHGTKLAEMPFIGTRHMYRRQGMCCRLLNGIESVLCSLNVQRLIIPAISELKNTWTTVFGFKPLDPSQELDVQSVNLLIFHDTGLLQKLLLPTASANGHSTANAANTVACDKWRCQKFDEASASGSSTPVHPDLHESPEFVVNSNLEINDAGHCSPAFHVCASSTSNSPEKFEVQTSKKSPSSDDDANLLALQGAVSHDEPIEFSVDNGYNLHCRTKVDGDTEEETVANADVVKISLDDSNTAKKKSKDNCTSMPSELSLHGTEMRSSCAFSEENCLLSPSEKFLAESGNHQSSKLSTDGAIDVTDKFKPNSNCNSRDSDGPTVPEKEKSSVIPDESISVVNQESEHDIHELETVDANCELQHCEGVKGSEHHTGEIVNGLLKDASGGESQASVGGSVNYNAFSLNLQVSGESSAQQYVETIQEPDECDNTSNVIHADCKTSSSGTDVLRISNYSDSTAGYFEQNPSGILEDSSQGLDDGRISETKDATIEMENVTCRVKSCGTAVMPQCFKGTTSPGTRGNITDDLPTFSKGVSDAVLARPNQICGEDAKDTNSREDDMAPGRAAHA